MKKFLLFFSIFLSANFLLIAQSNEDLPSATIYIIRQANPFNQTCSADFTISNQRSFSSGANSIVKYRIYSEGNVSITRQFICQSSTGSVSNTTQQVLLNIKRGNDYYVFSGNSSFSIVEKVDMEKYFAKITNIMNYEENLDFPINRASVQNIGKKEGKGQGSCILINSSGYLITNYHCIANAKEIIIRGIGGDFSTKYAAVVISADPSNDLALLKLVNKNLTFETPPFEIVTSGVDQGERIYALGFPMAQTMGEEVKVTEGIISSKSGIQGDISKFQISAAVNPGNSGGPLIDEDGNLIGIIYAKSTIADAAGYAIKAAYLKTFLENSDGFTYPIYKNTLKEKAIAEKISILKNYIFIVESN